MSPAERALPFQDRYRLYLDESGDHVISKLDEIGHQYLCLLGCWFNNQVYVRFHQEMEALKRRHLSYHPDDPPVLHREDIVNRRGSFGVLNDPQKASAFDDDLISLIEKSEFCVAAVVIDKAGLLRRYGEMANHPYHLGLSFMLQRFAKYLNQINRIGDVMAESRGGREDMRLKDVYTQIFERGIWQDRPAFFQAALTSKQLKVKSKRENIAGLQLADLLGHPVKQMVLKRYGRLDTGLASFAQRLEGVLSGKWHCHPHSGKTDGYGMVLFPK